MQHKNRENVTLGDAQLKRGSICVSRAVDATMAYALVKAGYSQE